MKASELATILLKYPDKEVRLHDWNEDYWEPEKCTRVFEANDSIVLSTENAYVDTIQGKLIN